MIIGGKAMNKRKISFLCHIQNRQFGRLFFKNWLLVFLSIMLPLLCCTIAIQYYSNKSMLQEIDASVKRSINNTKATLETLLEEAWDTLEKESLDKDIRAFLNTERTNPAGYGFSEKVNTVLDRLERDKRENLYWSLDVYSSSTDFLASTLYRGQLFYWISDQSLVECFEEYRKENPSRQMFIVPRVTNYLGREERVLTIYKTIEMGSERPSFVSVSINTEQLINYITDNKDANRGSYLIVNEKEQVILDTSGELEDTTFLMPETLSSSVTKEINRQEMMISWTDMEFEGLKCVQIIPMEKYHYNSIRLRKMIYVIVAFGGVLSILLSYITSKKLFRPIGAILRILENPSESENVEEQNGEIRYLLVRILDLFQKNISLEKEMLNRVFALRRAKAKALQEQMTPHFINNVLQTINWIAISETGEENSMTSQSIILLAEILETGKNQKYCMTTVMAEVEYTKKFVALERLRYGEGIFCHYEIDSQVKDMAIPAISLQTLVENSISHGFRTRAGCGNIYVSIHKNEEGGLHICVQDDGEGIEQTTIDKIFQMLEEDNIYVGEHLGLINFFQRFLLIYGEKCRFKMGKSKFGGASVEIWTEKLSEEWMSFMKE